jgi:carboxymethylenebutenolidase
VNAETKLQGRLRGAHLPPSQRLQAKTTMGSDIVITAEDGHQLGAYLSRPTGTVRGGLVVIQEAFGVNCYIRSVVDAFAVQGYLSIAPALYDRQTQNVQFGYAKGGFDAARKLRAGLIWGDVLRDVEAAANEVAPGGKVGIVGYCVGGSVAWLAGHHLRLAAAVSYYGSDIVGFLDRPPRCPTMLHFAERDAHIPLDDVETIRNAFPELPVYVFPGEHGFACDARPSYEPESTRIAGRRTLALFRKYIG